MGNSKLVIVFTIFQLVCKPILGSAHDHQLRAVCNGCPIATEVVEVLTGESANDGLASPDRIDKIRVLVALASALVERIGTSSAISIAYQVFRNAGMLMIILAQESIIHRSWHLILGEGHESGL